MIRVERVNLRTIRKKGLMSEALPAFIRFIFQSRNVNRLQAVTVEGNEASVAILVKMGFMYEGTMRQARHLKGKHVNLKVYAILKDEALQG
jgi:RimJ/RimL family protein N-acetyltransferase